MQAAYRLTHVSCSGIWVPERSLTALLKKEGAGITAHDLVLKAAGVKDRALKCATCLNQDLQKIETHGVELDVCTKCYGLFFDKSEISNLLPNSYKPQSSDNNIGQSVAIEGAFWIIIAFFTGGA